MNCRVAEANGSSSPQSMRSGMTVQRAQSPDAVGRVVLGAVEGSRCRGARGGPQRRADRADPGRAAGAESGAQQHRAVAAHRPSQERHPRGVQALFGEQRQELVEHHGARVVTGGAPMPVTVAAVDRGQRERWEARVDGIGEKLLGAHRHHGPGVTVLAVEQDHRPQRCGLPGRSRDDPVGRRTAACGRGERAGGVRGRGRCGWRPRRHRGRHGGHPGCSRCGRDARAQSECEHLPSADRRHARHHAIDIGVNCRKPDAATR